MDCIPPSSSVHGISQIRILDRVVISFYWGSSWPRNHTSIFYVSCIGRSEKALAPHSSILAWKIPWTEDPGGLQSMGLLGVGHGWVTSLSLLCIGEGNGNPLQCSCLENPRDGGAWWAAVYVVTQSRTRLKRLSSSSSNHLDMYLIKTLIGLVCWKPIQPWWKNQRIPYLKKWKDHGHELEDSI